MDIFHESRAAELKIVNIQVWTDCSASCLPLSTDKFYKPNMPQRHPMGHISSHLNHKHVGNATFLLNHSSSKFFKVLFK